MNFPHLIAYPQGAGFQADTSLPPFSCVVTGAHTPFGLRREPRVPRSPLFVNTAGLATIASLMGDPKATPSFIYPVTDGVGQGLRGGSKATPHLPAHATRGQASSVHPKGGHIATPIILTHKQPSC
ncbi:hypothetical protein AMTR_s00011p00259400 [Amborella trichopoda]|uniref:Uncharacterized protein n=1 Tax=Amborella trichopoda TaxID=13333 RepID=W1NH30_AMBTC|nr:hypothetical protein AMTR_s00011p00259400 [Amborella trichopoda]